MKVFGVELLREQRGDLKFLLNDSIIVFFPAAQQHRDMKAHGLSYEDDYQGNAMAGVIKLDRIEIRFHKAFSEERIKNICSRMLAIPEIADAGLSRVYYQGREIL